MEPTASLLCCSDGCSFFLFFFSCGARVDKEMITCNSATAGGHKSGMTNRVKISVGATHDQKRRKNGGVSTEATLFAKNQRKKNKDS